MIDRVHRLRAHARLRTIGDGNIGGREHRQVVRTVADCDRDPVITAIARGELRETRCFRIRIDDVADEPAGHASAGDLERIRKRVIECEARLQTLGEKREAAGDEQRFDVVASASFEQSSAHAAD